MSLFPSAVFWQMSLRQMSSVFWKLLQEIYTKNSTCIVKLSDVTIIGCLVFNDLLKWIRMKLQSFHSSQTN